MSLKNYIIKLLGGYTLDELIEDTRCHQRDKGDLKRQIKEWHDSYLEEYDIRKAREAEIAQLKHQKALFIEELRRRKVPRHIINKYAQSKA